MDHPEDGVVKFEAEHTQRTLPGRAYDELAGTLLGWRDVLVRLGGLGQDPGRYGGAGFGNVSARVGPFPGARGARPFLITGTQTGGWPCIGLDGLSLVRRYLIDHNRVVSEGAVPPSSEAMTHGAVYDLSPRIRCVLHVHAPVLWQRAAALDLPITPADVPYGTVAMAQAVARVARPGVDRDHGVFAMGGHPDGIIAWGVSVDSAGAGLVAAVARASALVYADHRAVCSPQGHPGQG